MLCMAELSHHTAPIALRERLRFSKDAAGVMCQTLTRQEGVLGAVLLSTCNRTEVYLSCDGPANPGELLCRGAGVEFSTAASHFRPYTGLDCARHLLEVACGLQSQILGEDQILTQVKTAAAIAREAGTTSSELEALFRTAAACGKAARAGGRLTGLPTSAAHQGVAVLREALGGLAGKRILVIGNGEMGKLAAACLREAGAKVTVTLRSYRHGETVIPAGCAAVPYDRRYEAMATADALLSATASPHYTVTLDLFRSLAKFPAFLVDLAIPRDIQPEIGVLPGVRLWNVDDLGASLPADHREILRIQNLVADYLEQYRQWEAYRSAIPAVEAAKNAVWERVRHYIPAEDQPSARLAVEKTVDLLAGGLKESLTAENWQACAEKILAHTR